MASTAAAVERPFETVGRQRTRFIATRVLIYGVLILWAFICLFPIYWTLTTSFKTAPDVMQGHLIPFVDFTPDWKGWRSLGLSPDTIFETSTVREEFLKRFTNSLIASLGASLAGGRDRLARRLRPGALPLPLRADAQQRHLVLLPVAAHPAAGRPRDAVPRPLQGARASSNSLPGLILVYTLMVLPIVIWIMRDQFMTIPIELEEAALVDGLTIWGTFIRIVLPLALPGIVAALILALVLCWNEYFFAALLTGASAKTLPVMVASQTGSQGISWWSMAALSTAAILPLVIVGVLLERYIIKGLTAGAVK